jgi:hypothetical protein
VVGPALPSEDNAHRIQVSYAAIDNDDDDIDDTRART